MLDAPVSSLESHLDPLGKINALECQRALVDRMILRDDPSSHDLNLGETANSDTLGDIAAMEFLFPLKERRIILGKLSADEKPNISTLAVKYGIPPFVIRRSFDVVPGLADIFD